MRSADRPQSSPSANPTRPHPSSRRPNLIIGDVVHFELAGVDVAQHDIGRTWAVNRGDASKLPFQPNRAQEGDVRDLIVGDVIDQHPAGGIVAHDHIGFAGGATEIADANDLPLQPDRPHEGGTML